ncbi:MAG: STAS domain-containing protein [Clostridia bacterium]|nr:STAS domain-containing protein [Clostridia bacterium]
MTINKTQNGEKLVFELEGRLDSATAPLLQEQLGDLSGISQLIFDMNQLEYVSSAGLRVLLKAQKVMIKQGSMKIVGVNSLILEVFEITGFSEIFTVEPK